MAVKTIWPIDHTCGHHADRDLSDRPAHCRADFAEWLARQECTDCWRASNEGDEQDKAAWLKAKRAEEQTASEAWSEQYRMPPLEGTERAVSWGVRCRHQILADAYTALVTEGFPVKFNVLRLESAEHVIREPVGVPADVDLHAGSEAGRPG